MNIKDWFILGAIITIYVLFGGVVFMFLERHIEIKRNQQISTLRKDVKETLLHLDTEFYSNTTTSEVIDALQHAKEGVLDRISDACNIGNLHDDTSSSLDDSTDQVLTWNLYNSVFFSFTVITAIGYGYMTPSTAAGKIFLIVYALFGIPLITILLTSIGNYFSSKLIKVRDKSKERQTPNNYTFFLEILFYLIPGLIVFFVVPSGVFALAEGWKFMDALYFTFVTLTTIGFGDFVAGSGSGNTFWMWLYKAGIIMWIIFGLGYLIMILGFITRGLKSKQIQVVIQKPISSILQTKEKLSKDIVELRRVVSEIYLMNKAAEDLSQEPPTTNGHMSSYENSLRVPSNPLRRRNVSIASWAELIEQNRKINTRTSFTSSRPSTPGMLSRGDTDISLNATFQASAIHLLSRDVLNCLKNAVEGLDEIGNDLDEIPGEVSNAQELKMSWDGESRDLYEDSKLHEALIHHSLEDEKSSLSSSMLSKVGDTIRKISTGSWCSSLESSPSRSRTPVRQASRKNSPSPSKGTLVSPSDYRSESKKIPAIRHERSETDLLKKEARAKMRRNVSFQFDHTYDETTADPNGFIPPFHKNQLADEKLSFTPANPPGDSTGIEEARKRRLSSINQRRRKYGTVFKPNLTQLGLKEDEVELKELKVDIPAGVGDRNSEVSLRADCYNYKQE